MLSTSTFSKCPESQTQPAAVQPQDPPSPAPSMALSSELPSTSTAEQQLMQCKHEDQQQMPGPSNPVNPSSANNSLLLIPQLALAAILSHLPPWHMQSLRLSSSQMRDMVDATRSEGSAVVRCNKYRHCDECVPAPSVGYLSRRAASGTAPLHPWLTKLEIMCGGGGEAVGVGFTKSVLPQLTAVTSLTLSTEEVIVVAALTALEAAGSSSKLRELCIGIPDSRKQAVDGFLSLHVALSHAPHLTSLTSMRLRNVEVDGIAAAALLPQLRHLEWSQKGYTLSHLAEPAPLVDMRACPRIRDLGALQQLTSLQLDLMSNWGSNNTAIRAQLLDVLATVCDVSQLRCLTLQSRSDEVPHLLSRLSNLTSLRIPPLLTVESASPEPAWACVAHLRSLQHVDFQCVKLDLLALRLIAAGCPQLTALECFSIDNTAWHDVPNAQPAAVDAAVRAAVTAATTMTGSSKLLPQLPNLKDLTITELWPAQLLTMMFSSLTRLRCWDVDSQSKGNRWRCDPTLLTSWALMGTAGAWSQLHSLCIGTGYLCKSMTHVFAACREVTIRPIRIEDDDHERGGVDQPAVVESFLSTLTALTSLHLDRVSGGSTYTSYVDSDTGKLVRESTVDKEIQITRGLMRRVAECSTLRRLTLECLKVCDADLLCLQLLTGLQELHLKSCGCLTDAIVPQLATTCKALRLLHISIEGAEQELRASLAASAHRWPQLDVTLNALDEVIVEFAE